MKHNFISSTGKLAAKRGILLARVSLPRSLRHFPQEVPTQLGACMQRHALQNCCCFPHLIFNIPPNKSKILVLGSPRHLQHHHRGRHSPQVGCRCILKRWEHIQELHSSTQCLGYTACCSSVERSASTKIGTVCQPDARAAAFLGMPGTA